MFFVHFIFFAMLFVIMVSVLTVLAIAWYIHIVVPAILYKIDWLTAGVVLVAVFAPFFSLSGRYMQINRLLNYWRTPYDYRFAVN